MHYGLRGSTLSILSLDVVSRASLTRPWCTARTSVVGVVFLVLSLATYPRRQHVNRALTALCHLLT